MVTDREAGHFLCEPDTPGGNGGSAGCYYLSDTMSLHAECNTWELKICHTLNKLTYPITYPTKFRIFEKYNKQLSSVLTCTARVTNVVAGKF